MESLSRNLIFEIGSLEPSVIITLEWTSRRLANRITKDISYAHTLLESVYECGNVRNSTWPTCKKMIKNRITQPMFVLPAKSNYKVNVFNLCDKTWKPYSLEDESTSQDRYSRNSFAYTFLDPNTIFIFGKGTTIFRNDEVQDRIGG
jgi:hypothetical protein